MVFSSASVCCVITALKDQDKDNLGCAALKKHQFSCSGFCPSLPAQEWAWTEGVLGNSQDFSSLLRIFLPTPGSSLFLNWNHPVLSMLNPILRGSPFPSLCFLLVCLQLSVTVMGSGTCCLPAFSINSNWNVKSFPHSPSYFSHFLHKPCVKCWEFPQLDPSALWWVLREILQLKNYLFCWSGKDFCSFAFLPPCLRQCLPIFTNLDLKVSEILLSKAKRELKKERAPVHCVLKDQTLQLPLMIVTLFVLP